jgi:hypothetical protein
MLYAFFSEAMRADHKNKVIFYLAPLKFRVSYTK